MSTIRVLVIEDSLTVRRYIVDLISQDSGFAVVGEAGDGKTAIELCQRLKPDVVTMDMMLPVMTGVAATEYIMAFCPTPILIVSASRNRGELFKTYDALAAGAVDVLEKPDGTETEGRWGRELLSALRVVSRVRVITHPRARLGRMGTTDKTVPVEPPGKSFRPALVALGASTGGPGAVLALLRSLPADFRLPILLVIHISEPFGVALAEWLDGLTGISVRYAEDGQPLPELGKGRILMAPPGRHLVLSGNRLRLTNDPEKHSCRPSVDVLFESLASQCGTEVMACLLTGMGKDGAAGLLALRNAGALTIAQDEETSVVFGMPGEAVRLGAAAHVLPLGSIGPFLATAASQRGNPLPGENRG